MGFDEGRIVLDSDNGAYYSGQTVNAKLVFDQAKVKTFRGIFAKIKGFCQVHWTTTHTRRVSDGRGGHRSQSYTVTHESHEVYIERKIYLVGGESGEHRLHPGKHEFPFSFPLPANCPSSFEGERGHIRYEIKVVVDRQFKIDQEKKIVLRVFAPLDLNADPYCNEPLQMEFEDSYCCCCMGSGSCETLVKVPKGGYCPGQVVPIEVKCHNDGNVEIEGITFAIEQLTTYRATQNPATKTIEDTVAKLKKGPVPGNTTRTWTVEMEVPTMDLYNVNTCQYIDIDYIFKVKVNPSGCHESSKETRRFVIGNIPLRGYQDDIPNPMQDHMPVQNQVAIENHQKSPSFGPVISQPMPNVTPFPGANSPYPAINPYPGANSPYPGSNPPYPGANPPYANGNSPYPAANPPYPTGNSQPGANPPYPAANSPYPTGNSQPGANTPYPAANSPYPTGNSQPGANPPYLGANSPYPAANSPYPTGNSQPGANSPYPGANPPYPGANSPYPGATPPYPGGAQPVSPYPGQYQGSPAAAPALPPGANVPFPTGPFVNASAPGILTGTPDDNKKNMMDDGASSPYNPNFKG